MIFIGVRGKSMVGAGLGREISSQSKHRPVERSTGSWGRKIGAIDSIRRAGRDMIPRQQYASVQAKLREYLTPVFSDARVQVGDNIHYRGTNVVITSATFDGLLPEQRFHHIVRAIPTDFYEKYLRGGVVWFELAPGENAKDYMKMPRSEDIANEEEKIQANLSKVDFFERLQGRLEKQPAAGGLGDFRAARALLREAGLGDGAIEKCCLHFIRQGAFDDAGIVREIMDAAVEGVDE